MRTFCWFVAVCLFTLVGCGSDDAAPSARTSESASSATDEDVVPTHSVTIIARVPADAPTVFVAGNLPVLGPWHPAALAMEGTGETRRVQIEVPSGHRLEYKITAGSWEQEGLGPSGTVLPNFTATITEDVTVTAEVTGFRVNPGELIDDWQGSGVEGTLVYWKDMTSGHLDEKRHVVVWLPPDYDPDSTRRYPVIYMHDGQNLFDPRMSYTNVDWGVDEAMMAGVRDGRFEPAIVVGIWNTPDRLWEYSPNHMAANYARFIIEELKPKVDAAYNVYTAPEDTYTMGSSMGGLVSLYLVRNHPDVFSACGCVSTHVTWSEQQVQHFRAQDPSKADATPFIVRSIRAGARMPPGQRLYFDYGTEGLDADYGAATEALRQWLIGQGYTEGHDLLVREFEGADHSESAWRARVGEQLEWLLGPR